ncbi:MAG: glycosyltransferase [Firmicutes bacterium]|nr:glycosyltransferase [Bacillota bacterium]
MPEVAAPSRPFTVSVIIPTYQAARTIRACLESIQQQTYPPDEVIVVDADSPDGTTAIAEALGATMIRTRPNRSHQRNLGPQHSHGQYLLFIYADMVPTPRVIEDCVQTTLAHPEYVGVVILEESFGTTFWGRVKASDRSFYQGVRWMEAARFVHRRHFKGAGGFDPGLVGGEDWDFDERLRQCGPIGRITAIVRHNEGALTLAAFRHNKARYAVTLRTNAQRHPHWARWQPGLAVRLAVFLRKPGTLVRHPVLTVDVLLWGGMEWLASRRPIATRETAYCSSS